MKKIITFCSLFVSLLNSETFILHSDKREIKILKEKDNYYFYGLKNRSYKVKSSGSLIIELQQGIDPKQFGKQHSLEFIRTNSTGTHIFKNLSHKDIIEVANQLQLLPETITVNPNWKRSRGLK